MISNKKVLQKRISKRLFFKFANTIIIIFSVQRITTFLSAKILQIQSYVVSMAECLVLPLALLCTQISINAKKTVLKQKLSIFFLCKNNFEL